MNKVNTTLNDCFVLDPIVHGDDRGFFIESWNAKTFSSMGLDVQFVQDNHSRSTRNVLRGLHYQVNQPQGKLVRVTRGTVFDAVVDLRRSSSTFGEWFGVELSESNKQMLWVPPGFAHGFLVLSEFADFQYKCTQYYSPEDDRSLRWDDQTVGIQWPINPGEKPGLSEKDAVASSFSDAETFR